MAHRIIPSYVQSNENQLLKSDYDHQMYDKLLKLLLNLNDSRPQQTIKNHHLDLVKWIIALTPKLQDSETFKVDLSTRCRWILSGRSDFPICRFCGKQFGFNRNMQVRHDYSEWCSNKCRQTDPVIVARTKATKFKNHGDENYCNPEKAKQTFYDHFGVSNPNKCKSVREKIEQTCLHNYGYQYASQAPEVKEKAAQTNLDRRGVKSPLADPKVREKGKQTSWEVYGTEFPIQSDIIKRRVKEGYIKNYGVDHNMKSEEGLRYWQECFKEKHNVYNPSHCPEIRAKIRRKYVYNGIQFDSAPEIAFYIWLKDNNIEFEYQPTDSFVYEYAQKKHLYFPDFKVGDIYFEIKGDQFFTKDGKMTCPFKNQKMTLEQYQYACEQTEAKHQCMLKNNVVILRSAEYNMFLLYVSQTYGKNYLKSFRVNIPNKS